MGLTDVPGLQIPMPAPDLTFDLPTTSPSRYPVALCIKPRRLLVFVFVCPAAISKLEEALWINNRKYDAPWCWEMLKLFAHYALRTKMRQGFQKMLQCFLKALNEVQGGY
ncbi:hypothetical protein D8674_035448 [Pyrus ussuriensis x Pyrus communis]|uniref:Uncharacterized protein n=1 Tax=Pyrus ussuriensis x Pyrus communis TaxID=2448454 RepID=A0A5N5GHV3_9ROSA|nr:hypothetical protein D8674_035448 [Pyrus ussuriensis x Pyrus communis]